jgi:hypothetical protein
LKESVKGDVKGQSGRLGKFSSKEYRDSGDLRMYPYKVHPFLTQTLFSKKEKTSILKTKKIKKIVLKGVQISFVLVY